MAKAKVSVNIRVHRMQDIGGKQEVGSQIPMQGGNTIEYWGNQEASLVLDNGGGTVLVDVKFEPSGTGKSFQKMELPPSEEVPWSSRPFTIGPGGPKSIAVDFYERQRVAGFLWRRWSLALKRTVEFVPMQMQKRRGG